MKPASSKARGPLPAEKPLPDDLKKALTVYVQRVGERAALEAIEITRATLSRALAGLKIRRGTVAQIRAALLR